MQRKASQAAKAAWNPLCASEVGVVNSSEVGEVTTSEVGVVTFIVMVCDHLRMTL